MARKLMQWEPRSDMVSTREAMDRWFDRAFDGWFFRHLSPWGLAGEELPAMDMYETNGNLVVKTAMPGVKAEDIDISVSGDTLTIKAETKKDEEIKEEDYLWHERRVGTYQRSIELPSGLKTDDVEAEYADGILKLKFTKSEKIMPRRIEVKNR
jgi:HSP20 family protein